MIISGIQVVGLIFALGILYVVFLNFKRKEITGIEFVGWVLLWAVFLLLTFIPRIVDPILQPLHIVRALDLYIIIGFMVLVAFHFHTYSQLKKMQKKVEKLVRRIALKEEETH